MNWRKVMMIVKNYKAARSRLMNKNKQMSQIRSKLKPILFRPSKKSNMAASSVSCP